MRFARCQAPAFDSLNRNAYGIYLVHYAFVNWLQYAMLSAPLPAISKGILVFFAGLMLSWGAVILLRRIPAIARVI
jgi:surface polysaccharide O-acyltransferase-like enzyme